MKKCVKLFFYTSLIIFLFVGYRIIDKNVMALQEKEEKVIKVACVGDSLTFRRSYDGWQICNYPTVLSELLGDCYEVKNYGMAGACVQSDLAYPYDSTRAYKVSVEAEADILIIMLGTNDIWNEGWRDEDVFYEHYINLIDSYLQTDNKPEIYLCTIPEVYLDANAFLGCGYNEKADRICSVIRQVAIERDYHLVEMHEATAKHPEWYEEDGVHINILGAKEVAKIIYDALDKTE